MPRPGIPAARTAPNSLFAAAMVQTGYALQVPPAELYYPLLPCTHVKIHGRRGVKVRGLWYDRPALDPYRDRLHLPPLLALQNRLLALLHQDEPTTTVGDTATAAQYFTDLRVLTCLLAASWPAARALVADQRHAERIDEHAAATRRRIDLVRHTTNKARDHAFYDTPPLDAATCAALLAAADTITRADSPATVRDMLGAVVVAMPSTHRVWIKQFLRGDGHCSPGLQTALGPAVGAMHIIARTGRRLHDLHPSLSAAAARWGIRMLLGLQDTPGAVFKASEVLQLRMACLPSWTVLDTLAEAGVLIDDRPPAIDTWFHGQLDGLPEPMTTELLTWFAVMRHGRSTSPRRRPRSETTIRLNITWALPILREWAAGGRTSLRDVSKQDVLDTLPAAGNQRSTAGQGLKSLFRILKEHKMLFTDPTRRVKTGEHESRQPVPANIDAIRQALNSRNVAQSAVVALIAFHGLRPEHLCRLKVTDLRDGRLHIDGRVIVVAEPVLARLHRWLDYRDMRWPNTLYDHFFLHYRTACRPDTAVGHRWLRLTIGEGLTASSIREDRILNEAHATNGDVRRLVDLFGLSVQASTRYTNTVDHPDLTRSPETG
jgi:hypothetical protein